MKNNAKIYTKREKKQTKAESIRIALKILYKMIFVSLLPPTARRRCLYFRLSVINFK